MVFISVMIILFLVVLPAYMYEKKENEKLDQRISNKHTAKSVRAAYISSRINNLKNSQIFGDAEVGLSGQQELYDRIAEEAKEMFKDGTTYIRLAATDRYRGVVAWNNGYVVYYINEEK